MKAMNVSFPADHAFPGITACLKNAGRLEIAQQMANCESSRTTGLYDRRGSLRRVLTAWRPASPLRCGHFFHPTPRWRRVCFREGFFDVIHDQNLDGWKLQRLNFRSACDPACR